METEMFKLIERYLQEAIDIGKANTDRPVTAKGMTFCLMTDIDKLLTKQVPNGG